MENSRLYALRVLHHDSHRTQHIVTHDEGMYLQIVYVLEYFNYLALRFLVYLEQGH